MIHIVYRARCLERGGGGKVLWVEDVVVVVVVVVGGAATDGLTNHTERSQSSGTSNRLLLSCVNRACKSCKVITSYLPTSALLRLSSTVVSCITAIGLLKKLESCTSSTPQQVGRWFLLSKSCYDAKLWKLNYEKVPSLLFTLFMKTFCYVCKY